MHLLIIRNNVPCCSALISVFSWWIRDQYYVVHLIKVPMPLYAFRFADNLHAHEVIFQTMDVTLFANDEKETSCQMYLMKANNGHMCKYPIYLNFGSGVSVSRVMYTCSPSSFWKRNKYLHIALNKFSFRYAPGTFELWEQEHIIS